MISHEKAVLLNTKLSPLDSKLVYPPQNLVDLTWKSKPVKPDAAIYIQPVEFTGESFAVFFLLWHFLNISGKDADFKLSKLREWIRQQPSSAPSYVKSPETNRQYAQTATLVTSLTCIGTIHVFLFNSNT